MPRRKSVNSEGAHASAPGAKQTSSDGTLSAKEHAAAAVGDNLRRLRRARRLSLRSLAEKSGLAVNTLSLIENSKTSPSVSTLQQLAIALDEPIVSFFASDTPRKRIVHLKADRRPKAGFDHGTCEILSAGFQDQRMQPLLVTLHSGAESGLDPIVHTGLEFVFCLDGTIDYDIGGERYRLEAGDSLLFEAHLPHCWQNPEPDPAQAIMVLLPSDEQDHPSDRHFLLGEKTVIE